MQITNEKLDLAWDFVNNTNRNIFLTGKAGTGKTTFLHKLKEESLKRMIVVAPTGVAAINAKGVTIHSFFQLPFGPITPDSSENRLSKKFAKSKINIIKSLDLLVIDEISMVRADVLDGIDQVLKRFRNKNKPFGGIQVLMIGDLQQLSPVIKEEEWQILKKYYSTGYFFGSNAFSDCDVLSIELTHIYRQESLKFIEILNDVRNNTLSSHTLKQLNERYDPNFTSENHKGYITLTTHNYRADQINKKELSDLKSASMVYKAEVDRNFPEYLFPTHAELELKVGAQVMFIKNDSAPEKRYFNGKIGEIVALDKRQVVVKCPGETSNIITVPETWENIRYTVDKENKSIKDEVIGSFKQMPLRLAWAITIHKSQGLTFDNIVVDAEDAFAHGQTYVALSRCRTLEGIVLTKPISGKNIINDQEVQSFTKQAEENQPDHQMLANSQRTYQLGLNAELFDFYSFLSPIERLSRIYLENRNSIKGNIFEKLTAIKDEGVIPLLRINKMFQEQVEDIVQNSLVENNTAFQDRFKKGVAYFLTHAKESIESPLEEIEFSTDNTVIKDDINNRLTLLEDLLKEKLFCLNGLKNGFNTMEYLELRAKAVLQEDEKPKRKTREVLDSTEHPILFHELRSLRMVLANAEDVPPYQIFTQQSLFEMCEYLPTTSKELRAISGIGNVRLKKYGEEILETIREYLKSHDVEPTKTIKIPEPKASKPKSSQITYDLYKSGKTIPEIAKERSLVVSTIKSHLAEYVASGDIAITELMPEEKYLELRELMEKLTYSGFGDLKSQIDEKFSFAEMRLVQSVPNFKRRETSE